MGKAEAPAGSRVRIPPESERLRFVRNNAAGTVHVACWGEHWDADVWNAVTHLPERDQNWGEIAVEVITGPGPEMLCGKHLKYGWFGSPGDLVTGFSDDDFCAGCIRALGGQSWRAFHADNRGEASDG